MRRTAQLGTGLSRADAGKRQDRTSSPSASGATSTAPDERGGVESPPQPALRATTAEWLPPRAFLPPDTSTAAFRHVRRGQEGEVVGAVAAAGLRRRPPARRPRRLRVAWVAAAAADLLGRPGVWTAWDPSQGTTPRPRNLGCIGASHESWDAQTALNDLTAALAADRV